jgi:hypothetical protein
MPEVVVHGQVTSQAGGASSPPEEAGLHLPSHEGHRAGAVPRGFTTPASTSRVPDPRPASPEAGPFLRCNNCGVLGHLPRACPNYGWYYPAPGKTRLDYIKDRQRVQDLIAGDIISEHEVHEDDLDVIVFQSARPSAALKEKARELTCPRCDQAPGEKCKTAAGDYTELHKARLDAVDSPGPGS